MENDYKPTRVDRVLFSSILESYDPDMALIDEADFERMHDQALAAFDRMNFTEAFVTAIRVCAAAVASGEEQRVWRLFFESNDHRDAVYFTSMNGMVEAARVLYANVVQENSLAGGIRRAKLDMFKDLVYDTLGPLASAVGHDLQEALDAGHTVIGQVQKANADMRALMDEAYDKIKDENNGEQNSIADGLLTLHKQIKRQTIGIIDPIESMMGMWLYCLTVVESSFEDSDFSERVFEVLVDAGLPRDWMVETAHNAQSNAGLKTMLSALDAGNLEPLDVTNVTDLMGEGWVEDQRELMERVRRIIKEYPDD